jgi:hypothetical protein
MQLPREVREVASPFLISFVGLSGGFLILAATTGRWTCVATECDVMAIYWVIVFVPMCIAIGIAGAAWAKSTQSGAIGITIGALGASAVDAVSADWQNQLLPPVLSGLPFLILILPAFYIVRSIMDGRAARTRPWPANQAPPNHKCGRCGKPLSPVWRDHCKHCGAKYLEFPPVPRG